MDNKFSMGGTSTQKYLPNLDILKFVCAIIVVFYHTANLEVYGKNIVIKFERDNMVRGKICFTSRMLFYNQCFFSF